jgi:hypothetical protein
MYGKNCETPCKVCSSSYNLTCDWQTKREILKLKKKKGNFELIMCVFCCCDRDSVKMEPFAISRTVRALAPKAGPVPIAVKELVPTSFTVLDALRSVRALQIILNCKCFYRVSFFVVFRLFFSPSLCVCVLFCFCLKIHFMFLFFS